VFDACLEYTVFRNVQLRVWSSHIMFILFSEVDSVLGYYLEPEVLFLWVWHFIET
jgi:hypothetical protein